MLMEKAPASVLFLADLDRALDLTPAQRAALHRALRPYIGERVYFAKTPQTLAHRIKTAMTLLDHGEDRRTVVGILADRLQITRKVARRIVAQAMQARAAARRVAAQGAQQQSHGAWAQRDWMDLFDGA